MKQNLQQKLFIGSNKSIVFAFFLVAVTFLFMPQNTMAKDCSVLADENYTVGNLAYHTMMVDLKSSGNLIINLKVNGKIDVYVMTKKQYDQWLEDPWETEMLLKAQKINQLKDKSVAIEQAGDYSIVFSNKRSLIKEKSVSVNIKICPK